MGTHFKAMNRSNTMISFKDVETTKGLLRIRRHHPERYSPEETAEMERSVHDEERFVLLDRFDHLWSLSGDAVAHWERTATGGPRLIERRRTDLRCWMETVEKFQADYPDQLHVAHLLQVRTNANQDLLGFNLRYLYLSLLSDPTQHITAGYLDSHANYTGTLDPVLEHLAGHRLLRRHLEPSTAPRTLRSLPANADERAGVLGLYMDYLILSTVRVASADWPARENPLLADLLSFRALRAHADAPGYLGDQVARLGGQLDDLLAPGAD